ncbi:hypothetical protein JTB14_002173 [Gonioctena quinquepunctata]|nr:hypothetical protein JTB14_002173 [Gonioctena quinquepunctata]
MPWEDICNPGKITEDFISQPILNESVWLSWRRFLKYGHYEYRIWGVDYGKPLVAFSFVQVGDPEYFKKDCVILDPQKVGPEPEYCSANHKHLCEFDKREDNQYCPEGCVSAGINSQKCYCKLRKHCSALANVKTITDKNILSDLAGRDQCYVGQGPSSEMALEGFKPALSKNEWFYTTKDLDCSLCLTVQLKRSTGKVELLLNFEAMKRKLYLMIYYPEAISTNENVDYISCFTDAATFELKKRVNVKKIVDQHNKHIPFNVYQVSLEDYMGRYWCEVHRNDVNVSSNTVVAYRKKRGNEYALRLRQSKVCVTFKCGGECPIRYENFIPQQLTKLLGGAAIRVMKIIFFDFAELDFVLHVTTTRHKNVEYEFARLRQNLSCLIEAEVVYFRSSEYCFPEQTSPGDHKVLTWPLTVSGKTAVPEEVCLQKNGLPVYRVCEGDFLYGVDWSDVMGDCEVDSHPSESIAYFHSLLSESLDVETIENVSSVIRREPDLPVLCIYYVSRMLEALSSSNLKGDFADGSLDVVGATVNITNDLLNINEENLATAQYTMNITDCILDLVDDLLKMELSESEVVLIQRENIIVHVSNPLLSNVSGIVVYTGSNGVTVENMRRNDTFNDVKYDEDFHMAVYIPENILEDFQGGNVTVITTIFLKDHFFASNYSKKPAGPVISVTIPEYGCYLPGMLPILFKSVENAYPECGFWDYGKKTIPKRGNWSTIGGTHTELYENDSLFHTCHFSHLTHFALLILEEIEEDSTSNDTVLSVLIYLSDFLSISGVFGVFATAVVFKKWRKKQGTIILLNLCLAIILELLLTELPRNTGDCHFLGKFIHYVVVSKFAWMLVYSFLQYMRFVKVFAVLPEKIVLISLIFGWGFGLIPVSISALLGPSSYSMMEHSFCYPSGLVLYLGFIAPIITIIIVNTFVFFIVMRQVTTKTVESHANKDNIQKLQVQLATLLFFVLGIPWLLLILTKIVFVHWLKKALIYVFTVLSNVDGLILFLFYVVFNSETRHFWINFFTKKNPRTMSSTSKISSLKS